jgi:hypothetical protein
MRINENNIYVRQSWLNDALMCPERGRFAITQPEWSSGSDATVLGTAVHAGIEHELINHNDSVAEMREIMWQTLNDTEPESFKWTSMKSIEDMGKFGEAMLLSWYRDIRPHVEMGGLVEHQFVVPLGELVFNDTTYKLHYTGTIDYVTPSGVVWDWKTAARKYQQGEKQRQSIQASVYAFAVKSLGLTPDFPVNFKFGVMTRSAKSEGQVVDVLRTSAHASWVATQTMNIVSSALRMGLENNWLQVDQHFLCSEQWCSWWSICKGAHLSEQDNRWNPQQGE